MYSTVVRQLYTLQSGPPTPIFQTHLAPCTAITIWLGCDLYLWGCPVTNYLYLWITSSFSPSPSISIFWKLPRSFERVRAENYFNDPAASHFLELCFSLSLFFLFGFVCLSFPGKQSGCFVRLLTEQKLPHGIWRIAQSFQKKIFSLFNFLCFSMNCVNETERI